MNHLGEIHDLSNFAGCLPPENLNGILLNNHGDTHVGYISGGIYLLTCDNSAARMSLEPMWICDRGQWKSGLSCTDINGNISEHLESEL